MLFEPLRSPTNISWLLLSLGPHEALSDGSSCPLKAFAVEQATTPTAQGRVLTLLQADGSCLLCSPKIKTSQLTPETRESSAAGVRARACYSSSWILCNTLLFNTIKLQSSAQWVTLADHLLSTAQPFQFFQYFEKSYINNSVITVLLIFLIAYCWYLLDQHVLKYGGEIQDYSTVIKIKIAFWGIMPTVAAFLPSPLLFSAAEESVHRLDHFYFLCIGRQANSSVVLCTNKWLFGGKSKIPAWKKA